MAKKMRRMLVLLLALVFSFSMFATPALAWGDGDWDKEDEDFGFGNWGDYDRDDDDDDDDRGNKKPGQGSSNSYEWYQVIINGTTAASGQGPVGDVGWLVRGTYTYRVNISGTTMSWRAGNQSGSINVANYVSIPEGYEVAEGGYTVASTSVSGTNSQAAQYDNATITVTITALYNPVTGETLPVGGDPDPTDPPATDPVPVETKVTVNHTYKTYDAYTKQTVVDGTSSNTADVTEGDSFTATAVPSYNGNSYTQQTDAAALTITAKADASANVINIEYLRTIDTTPAPVETKVTVNHFYYTYDIYTKQTVLDGSTTGTEDAIEGQSYTAAAVPTFNGNTYTRQSENLTIVIKDDAAENIINIDYLRNIDTTPENYTPSLSVVKTAAKDTYKEGDTVSWTITVKNTSAYPAYDVVVSDALTGDSWSIASLAPGAEQSFTATVENAQAGTIKNVVVVSWDDGDEIPDEDEPEEPKFTSDEDTVIVEEPVNYTPVLSVVKTADKATYETGETITWTITVKNISEYTAYDVVVSDALTGDRWSIASLAPGAEQSFTAKTENAAAGSVKNVAVVSWSDGDEIPDSEEPNEIKSTSDEEIVGIEDPAPENFTPVLSVVKTAGKEIYAFGETISWTITVKNVSEYPAYDIVVVDELAKGYWTIASLAPGAEQTFTATMENVAAGSVKNVVVVSWNDGDEIPDEDEPNEITSTSDEEVVTVEEPKNYAPVVSVSKTADKASYKTGETITWTITVKNISEYTAYDVVITDELTGDTWTIAFLAPGAEQVFTAKTENAAAGSVKNVVVATWDDKDDIDDADESDEVKTAGDEEIVEVKKPDPKPPVQPTEPTDPEPTETEPKDNPVAQDDEIEIPDEEVPLASAPKTGDISLVWIALSGLSAGGMIVLGKKREEDEE